MKITCKFKLNCNIAVRKEPDNWGLLFDADTGQATGVNPTGLFVLQRLKEDYNLGQILQLSREHFCDLSAAHEQEIENFLIELIRRGFITTSENDA